MIEQEVKVSLTPEVFGLLVEEIAQGAGPTRRQENYYYDSPDSLLKDAQAALRLRQYEGGSEWTLKQALGAYQSRETTQMNGQSLSVIPQQLNQTLLWDSELLDALHQLNVVLTSLEPTYAFITERWIVDLGWGECVLDATYYGDQVDYEIEVESENLSMAQAYLQDLSQTYAFPLLPASRKIARVTAYFQERSRRE